MKKILTLLIALGAIASVQAQSGRSYPGDHSRDRDVILGQRNDRTYENDARYTYSFSARERDKQIDRINRDYDKRIRQVEKDRRLRSAEKSYQVRRLENQRKEEISQVWDRFRSRNNMHSDNRYRRDDRNDRRW